ncbi:homeobox-like protein HDP1 isoform X2 [Prorops nasuta]|uniref:homeobox-like protein HDP1 isoform X2 n=1 Tax=Prorops nasuta TaxID=863751 RepID=UPI0034CFABDD
MASLLDAQSIVLQSLNEEEMVGIAIMESLKAMNLKDNETNEAESGSTMSDREVLKVTDINTSSTLNNDLTKIQDDNNNDSSDKEKEELSSESTIKINEESSIKKEERKIKGAIHKGGPKVSKLNDRTRPNLEDTKTTNTNKPLPSPSRSLKIADKSEGLVNSMSNLKRPNMARKNNRSDSKQFDRSKFVSSSQAPSVPACRASNSNGKEAMSNKLREVPKDPPIVSSKLPMVNAKPVQKEALNEKRGNIEEGRGRLHNRSIVRSRPNNLSVHTRIRDNNLNPDQNGSAEVKKHPANESRRMSNSERPNTQHFPVKYFGTKSNVSWRDNHAPGLQNRHPDRTYRPSYSRKVSPILPNASGKPMKILSNPSNRNTSDANEPNVSNQSCTQKESIENITEVPAETDLVTMLHDQKFEVIKAKENEGKREDPKHLTTQESSSSVLSNVDVNNTTSNIEKTDTFSVSCINYNLTDGMKSNPLLTNPPPLAQAPLNFFISETQNSDSTSNYYNPENQWTPRNQSLYTDNQQYYLCHAGNNAISQEAALNAAIIKEQKKGLCTLNSQNLAVSDNPYKSMTPMNNKIMHCSSGPMYRTGNNMSNLSTLKNDEPNYSMGSNQNQMLTSAEYYNPNIMAPHSQWDIPAQNIVPCMTPTHVPYVTTSNPYNIPNPAESAFTSNVNNSYMPQQLYCVANNYPQNMGPNIKYQASSQNSLQYNNYSSTYYSGELYHYTAPIMPQEQMIKSLQRGQAENNNANYRKSEIYQPPVYQTVYNMDSNYPQTRENRLQQEIDMHGQYFRNTLSNDSQKYYDTNRNNIYHLPKNAGQQKMQVRQMNNIPTLPTANYSSRNDITSSGTMFASMLGPITPSHNQGQPNFEFDENQYCPPPLISPKQCMNSGLKSSRSTGNVSTSSTKCDIYSQQQQNANNYQQQRRDEPRRNGSYPSNIYDKSNMSQTGLGRGKARPRDSFHNNTASFNHKFH